MIESINFFRQNLKENPVNPENKNMLIKEAYFHIRNIPFSFSKENLKDRSFKGEVEHFIEFNRGSCSTKHYILGIYYESLGVPVIYSSYEFFWQNQKINYPPKLQEYLTNLPKQYHSNLLIKPNSNSCWKTIDATWDPHLFKIGVHINEFENQQSAVFTNSEAVFHRNAFEKWDYLKSIKRGMKENENIKNFYRDFDSWISSTRS